MTKLRNYALLLGGGGLLAIAMVLGLNPLSFLGDSGPTSDKSQIIFSVYWNPADTYERGFQIRWTINDVGPPYFYPSKHPWIHYENIAPQPLYPLDLQVFMKPTANLNGKTVLKSNIECQIVVLNDLKDHQILTPKEVEQGRATKSCWWNNQVHG